MPVELGTASAYDYEKLVIGIAASKLTAAKRTTNSPVGAKYVTLTVETNPIRYREDDVDPTATDGMLVAAGATVEIKGKDRISKLRMIRQGAADAVVHVHYYR
jgi:hypothetical protein